jgi:hypothetical protein
LLTRHGCFLKWSTRSVKQYVDEVEKKPLSDAAERLKGGEMK